MLRLRKSFLAQQLLQQEETSRILDAIEMPPSDPDSYYSGEPPPPQQQQQQYDDDDDDFQVQRSFVAASSRHSVMSRSNLPPPAAARQSALSTGHSVTSAAVPAATSLRQSPAPSMNRSAMGRSVGRNSVEPALAFSFQRSQPLEEEDYEEEEGDDPFSDQDESDERSAANTRSVISTRSLRQQRKKGSKLVSTLAPMDDEIRAEVNLLLKQAISQATDDIVEELGLPRSEDQVYIHSNLKRMKDTMGRRICRKPIPTTATAKMFNRKKMEQSNAKQEATLKSMLTDLIMVERRARDEEVKLEEEEKQYERLQELQRAEQDKANKKREELLGLDELLAQDPPSDDYVLSILNHPSSKFS